MSWELSISKIAGIRSGSATIEPDINAIRGTNWQGKSSFIAAIETAMGTKTVLTEGEDQGHVELSTGEETVSIELTCNNGTVERHGTPLLSDEQTRVTAALYTFLDDENDVRQAVRNHKNLESVLTRPLDFENIDEQIADLTRERDQVERERERAQDAAEQLLSTQETVHELENELNDLETKRGELEAVPEAGSETGTHREELSDAKAERNSIENQIERLEQSAERTRDKLESRRTELDELAVPKVDRDLEAEIADAEDRYTELEQNRQLLQSIYAPTKRILDEDRLELITDVQRDIMEDTLECWTCGNETTREEIAGSLDQLSEQILALQSKATEQKNRADELRERQSEYEQASRRKSDLESEIEDLKAKLEDREASLEGTRERLDEIENRIETLSEQVQTANDKLTDLESQIKYTKTSLDDAKDELESLESRADQREQLQKEYDTLTEEIKSLRNRKETLKQRTREAFDNAIQDVLSRFDVGFEMVRLTSNFDLVVARDGRESSLGALSEGELELLGIVACLAGFEAFDVANEVPIMLLDSLGGLADENLRTLIEYLSDRVEFLVFTTYPENTQFESHTIEPAEWSVVSPRADMAGTSD
jgi:chromosome segregation ATPase